MQKNDNKDFNKDLIKRLASIYKFCNKDIKFSFVIKKRDLSI